jgi:hypothetical protein
MDDPEIEWDEAGEWEPRHRDPVVVPENMAREIHRLVWWLEDVGCVRSPFILSPDCFEIEDIRPVDMCARCRALRPYEPSRFLVIRMNNPGAEE